MSELETLLSEMSINEEFITKFVTDRFGADATVMDFKLTGAVFSLRSLPPSYATTAMVKTLRGNGKNKIMMNRPEFGIVNGNRKYTNTMLCVLVEDVMNLLKQGDALEMEELHYDHDTENYDELPPRFLQYGGDSQHVVDKETCEKMGKIFVLCGEKNGDKTPEPVCKKHVSISPDDLLEKLKKSGVLKKAKAKANKMVEKFLSDNPDFDATGIWCGKHLLPYRGKSTKNGLVVTFFCGKKVRIAGMKAKEVNKPEEAQVPILITKWSDDGSELQEWSVEWKDCKVYQY